MAFEKSSLPDYWAVNRNLSVSLVNGLYHLECIQDEDQVQPDTEEASTQSGTGTKEMKHPY